MLFKLYFLLKRMQTTTLKAFGENGGKYPFTITICDRNRDIASVFAQVFAQVDPVEVVCGNILHVAGSALVSPANSFGDMGGGLDKAIDDFFEGEAQSKVQAHILQEFWGEMPVGMASVLPMHFKQFPYLIVAPTMRIPGNVGKTIHAYLAMRAILVAILKHNRATSSHIKHVVMSSLCTGVGGMPYEEAAEQMSAAVRNILDEQYQSIVHPVQAPYVRGAKWIQSGKANNTK